MTHVPVSTPTAQWQWWYDTATGSRPELFCYTAELSLAAGAPIELRVHTTAERFDLVVHRDGANADVAYRAAAIPGASHPVRAAPYREGCDWPVTLSVDTEGWRPGGYVIVVSAAVDDVALRHAHWVALRPDRLSSDRLTLVASTATWNAYNAWGGSSHYGGIDGPNADSFSPVLSYHRPLQAGMAWLPRGAPRAPNPPREPGSHVFYDDMDWAFSHAHHKHYASAGWATYERHFVRWAETQGYGVDVVTQHDLHLRPELFADAGPLVFAGHDEYWTREMREHLDALVDRGGQVARLAGNFIWQIRLSADGSTQTCFKYSAPSEDPVRDDPDRRHLLTYAWDVAEIGYPGAQTFGCTGSRGMYVSVGGLVTNASGGFTIYRPDHWMLAGTHACYGDVLGAGSRVATYEVDGLDYVIDDGLPRATGADGIDPGAVEIVGLCVAANHEHDPVAEGSQLDVGDNDLEMLASARYGEVTPETLEKAARGCGVMSEYRRGRGRVVSAAAVEWVNGLRLRDVEVEQVTRNVLDALLAASAC
jgi:N,N-dimethylformamidase beta subunit-like protein